MALYLGSGGLYLDAGGLYLDAGGLYLDAGWVYLDADWVYLGTVVIYLDENYLFCDTIIWDWGALYWKLNNDIVMAKTYWMARSRVGLNRQVVTTVDYIVVNISRLGLAPDTPMGKWFKDVFMDEHYKPYIGVFGVWEDPSTQTPLVTADLKDKQQKLIPMYRMLCSILKASPLVTDGDLEVMLLPKRPDNMRHPAPVADNAPTFYVHPLEGHRIRLFYFPESAYKAGKPDGQHGVEIRWGLSEILVNSPETLINSIISTASPHTLTFHPDDGGRHVYITMRWENTRGIKGPWSKIERAIIP